MGTCDTCKHLWNDKKQSKSLGKSINFCRKIDAYSPIVCLLSAANGGNLQVINPEKFGCIFHQEK